MLRMGGALFAGDTILAVNEHHVNIDNVDSVLATLSNKIHFLVKRGSRHSYKASNHSPVAAAVLLSPPPLPSPRMGSSGGLVRLVAGGRGSVLAGGGARKRWRHLHMLLYITLDVKEDDPPEKVSVTFKRCVNIIQDSISFLQDILFQYPRISEDEGGGGKATEQLLKLRGVFLTLSDTLATVTGSLSICKFVTIKFSIGDDLIACFSVSSSILLDGQLMHLSSCQRDKELLLIALPADQ